MAKLERTIHQRFGPLLQKLEEGILSASISASLEDSWDVRGQNSRCSVRVFERYSYFGGNRVSMSLTLYQEGDGPVRLCAVTSGGSQAMFFKLNTLGEENFLATLEALLDNLTVVL